ncbi:glycosyltransferase [Polymorphobacter sp. PAMC 29334]|nr:glycosyltransferase [Polymorphobacter sp. PAMC 29334]
MSRTLPATPDLPPAPPRAVAIAVPAHNEDESIGACLGALDLAATTASGPVFTVVLVNNSRDKTAQIARQFRALAMTVVVAEVELPADRAHAGGARRTALDWAAALLPADGVLMTTDADSVVDRGWIAANLAELITADAVAGVVAFDEATQAALPPLPLRALEWRLADHHARLASLIDPRPHDPWPNHVWAWGASLALTLAAYRRIGGLPIVALAEDRAMAAAIEAHDLRLRHSHAPVVYTSARLHGRAPGGFADLLRTYAADDTALCDAVLEPTELLVQRLKWRATLRQRFERQNATGFGAQWQDIEATVSGLARQRLAPADLAYEVALAERLISRLESAARRGDTRAFDPARPLSLHAHPLSPHPEMPSPPSHHRADNPGSARASGPA